MFKPSQILKTEFPEHDSFHEEVDSHYRNVMAEHHSDNQLRPSLPSSSEHAAISDGAGPTKKHNHMIHVHLIPHIYVPVVHSGGGGGVGGFDAGKHYGQPAGSDEGLLSPSLPAALHPDASSEFQHGDMTAAGGPSTVDLPPSSAGNDHDLGNFNGHSGETAYYTISEDAVHQHNQEQLRDNFGNALDVDNDVNNNHHLHHHHDFDVNSNSAPDEPHQYQVSFRVPWRTRRKKSALLTSDRAV